jgi:metal-responsive CopG/Arc/MetJ family transcriptional regulator
MGRKARPDLGKYMVKLPLELVGRLDSQAGKEDRSRSELLADGAELYLKRAKRQPAKRPKK